MFLIRFFNIGRKWSAKAISEHRFLVKFPTVEIIKELQIFAKFNQGNDI
jgi:hypothetical protein